jgi:hypothetical protein
MLWMMESRRGCSVAGLRIPFPGEQAVDPLLESLTLEMTALR